MVHGNSCNFRGMPENETYKDRLITAMELASVDEMALAKGIGVTYQAVMKVINETSVAFKAENSAKAAEFLKVEHFWLATGEGKPRPERAWPYELFTRADYMLVDEAYRRNIENMLAGEVLRAKLKTGIGN